MALIAFTTLQESYESNAGYLENDSLTEAKAFITAATQLIARMPAESTNDDATVKMQVELISEQIRDARKWVRANGGEGYRRTSAAFRTEMRR